MKIGTDIIEIERVEKSARNEAFINGVFTSAEKEYYELKGKHARTLAGMFCAKEAVAKALGTGFCGFRPCDIEILHTDGGAPVVRLCGKAHKLFPNAEFDVSISHCESYAVATALYVERGAVKNI